MEPNESLKLQHQEEKDGLIESVDKKIDFLVKLHRLILDNEKMRVLNLEQLTELLNYKFDDLCEKTDLHEKMAQVEEIKKQIEEISSAVKDRENPLSQDDVVEKRFRRSLLQSKIHKLVTDDDELSFVYQVRKNINHILKIKNKYTELENIKQKDESEFENKIVELMANCLEYDKNKTRKSPIDYSKYLEYVKDIKSEGLHFHVILKKIAHKKSDFKDLLGFYIKGTSVIVTFEDSPEDTYVHEQNHLIYNSLEDHYIMYDDKLIQFILNRVGKRQESSNRLLKNIFEEYSPMDDVISEIKKYKNSLNGEILADIDRIFYSRQIYGFYAHFMNTISKLKRIGDNVNNIDIEVFKKIKPFIEQLVLDVDKKIQDIGFLVYVANRFNLIEETKSAFILFRGDVVKIKRYLKHKISDQDFNALPEKVPDEYRLRKAKGDGEFSNLIKGILTSSESI